MAKKRTDTPPYVPRKGLRTVLDHIQSRAAGDLLTREELHKRGLSAHLTYPALAALRFIGLLDDQDRLTGKHLAFKPGHGGHPYAGGSDPRSLRRLLRCRIPSGRRHGRAQGTVPEGLHDLSDRVINSSFSLFQYLAQEAGIALVKGGIAAPIADEPRHVVHPAAHIQDLEGDLLTVSAAKLAQGEEPCASATRATKSSSTFKSPSTPPRRTSSRWCAPPTGPSISSARRGTRGKDRGERWGDGAMGAWRGGLRGKE